MRGLLAALLLVALAFAGCTAQQPGFIAEGGDSPIEDVEVIEEEDGRTTFRFDVTNLRFKDELLTFAVVADADLMATSGYGFYLSDYGDEGGCLIGAWWSASASGLVDDFGFRGQWVEARERDAGVEVAGQWVDVPNDHHTDRHSWTGATGGHSGKHLSKGDRFIVQIGGTTSSLLQTAVSGSDDEQPNEAYVSLTVDGPAHVEALPSVRSLCGTGVGEAAGATLRLTTGPNERTLGGRIAFETGNASTMVVYAWDREEQGELFFLQDRLGKIPFIYEASAPEPGTMGIDVEHWQNGDHGGISWFFADTFWRFHA